MEPLKEQRWRLTRQSGSKLRALQTLPRGSVAPSNIEAADMDRDVMMREAFGVREACFRFAMKPGKAVRPSHRFAAVQVHQKMRCSPMASHLDLDKAAQRNLATPSWNLLLPAFSLRGENVRSPFYQPAPHAGPRLGQLTGFM